uniref:Uncharacterized protein n=1 Tax=Romanomermis culicivorax TaxID=13658 RepID=A0A915J619_ROMCU
MSDRNPNVTVPEVFAVLIEPVALLGFWVCGFSTEANSIDAVTLHKKIIFNVPDTISFHNSQEKKVHLNPLEATKMLKTVEMRDEKNSTD